MPMAESLRFHPHVASDLRDAIRWYTNISPELANRFRGSVNSGLDGILKNPVLYPIAFEEVRFVRVRSFPHLILYRLLGNTAYVLGVFHGASDPDKWRQRAES
ncbi:MAG: type II toxin-antitoxin system RelE/ParE family toxin [Chloroflexi bacterium]|nr:type II toxin-antitoxin system RelE/ParE family toxin [Chloroflexota bacterium]